MGKPVTFIDRLRNAHRIVAGLTADNAVYAPIFERLEAELNKAEAIEDVQARARAVVESYKAIDATTL